MKNKNIQTLIQKWIKIYKREKDEDLIKLYKEDFEGKHTPRRDEDKARREALIALVGDKLNQINHTQGEWKISSTGFSKDEKRYITNHENDIVAHAYGDNIEESEANAERIVKAVNMHDELVKELVRAKQRIVFLEGFTEGKADPTDLNKINQLLKQAEQK